MLPWSRVTPIARRRAIGAIAFALVVAFEIYALFIKRSGETSYLPSAAGASVSLEVAGAVTLEQSFVMGADGLESITIFPQPAPSARGVVQVSLLQEGLAAPVALQTYPIHTLSSAAWTWPVPRVDRSSGRTFTLRVALPDAAAGEGVRFVIGEPRYANGRLLVGGRPQWGDLKFATQARRARTIDAIRDSRRTAPAWVRSDAALVGLLLLFNWAVATVLFELNSRPFQAITAARPGDARSG